jgi:hypothetical protein
MLCYYRLHGSGVGSVWRIVGRIVVLALAAAFGAAGGESVLLTTGQVLRAERHQVEGATVRLHVDGGTIEFPAALVVRFEAELPRGTGLQPVGRQAEPPAPQSPALNPQELLRRAAERWGLPPEFLASVAEAESGFRSDAVSPKGALGLMQLMPATAELLGADPNDPAENADAGARYLRQLLLKYGYSAPLALAAYNAGPGAVDRHGDIPPYRETVEYVDRVLRQYRKRQPPTRPGSQNSP